MTKKTPGAGRLTVPNFGLQTPDTGPQLACDTQKSAKICFSWFQIFPAAKGTQKASETWVFGIFMKIWRLGGQIWGAYPLLATLPPPRWCAVAFFFRRRWLGTQLRTQPSNLVLN